MKNILGDPVDGANFFGREAELTLLRHKISRQSLILSAPRRVGKTSLMYRFRDRPPEGWAVVHFNAESCATEKEFIASWAAALREAVDPAWWRRVADWPWLHETLDRINKVDAKVFALELARSMDDSAWKQLGARVIKTIEQGEGDRLVVVVDEFPFFIERLAERHGVQRVEDFLHWFRSLRQEAASSGRLRFILYGSIGLDGVLGRLKASKSVNDLAVMHLGGFDRPTALAMLRALAEGEGVPLSEATAVRLLDRLGDWLIPFHIQFLFSLLLDRWVLQEQTPTPDLVDVVYQSALEPAHRKSFAHWEERLDEAFGARRARIARTALQVCCSPTGSSYATVAAAVDTAELRPEPGELEEVLLSLGHDGYLAQQDEQLVFASPLLRDWWAHWRVR